VLGESVSWGQGLQSEHKYAYLLKKAFTRGAVEAVLDMHAHSGAYLGISHSGKTTSIDPEIPVPSPLIIDQLNAVKDPFSTDIVLMHGGVNDIGLATILSPLTSSKKLYELIRSVCYADMGVFLRKMIQVFSKLGCRYVVGGYYPILSHDSCLLVRGELDPSLELFLKINGIKLPSENERAVVTNQMIIRALQFWHESASAMQQAVNEVAAEANLGKRLVFVPAPMKESNALFTRDPWLYESMLREMRDAAGDSGEFYTPRAVVRFMVTVTDPRLGETVLDPAAGTGGFLVEAYNHLSQQVKTVADRRILQSQTLFGCEPKSLPYLLCQMNLLLHGLDSPQIDHQNALRHKLTSIGEKERVDVILTNPPFGGEEERGIQGNFPDDKQTAETALLFLQLIMRKLRRQGGNARAAVVVPNGTLFGDGVCARIKEELLKEFNLHTIVRLPNGVFAPYTGISTNILFFDRSGTTKEVWFYEQPLPEGRKNYTKTAPIQFEEFTPIVAWWEARKQNDLAWRITASELLNDGCNLDRKNPAAKTNVTHLPPEQLAINILQKEQRIAEIMGNIQKLLLK
jgi:hypothetical protein